MNRHELTERTAAGLRRMNYEPFAFLATESCTDEIGDWDEICGIPVFFSALIHNNYTDAVCGEVPLIPIFNTRDKKLIERRRFDEGFESLDMPQTK